jgi:hypothetical protein
MARRVLKSATGVNIVPTWSKWLNPKWTLQLLDFDFVKASEDFIDCSSVCDEAILTDC